MISAKSLHRESMLSVHFCSQIRLKASCETGVAPGPLFLVGDLSFKIKWVCLTYPSTGCFHMRQGAQKTLWPSISDFKR